ncbi:MAG: MFS transporter [Bacteroidales bacterium]
MKYISSGHGEFPFISLIAILSVSLAVNLPGMAISPLLGDLTKVFPTASHLEIQLLSILPNFVVIPFVLLSGKLAESKSQTGLLFIGLTIFLGSSFVYFFAHSMVTLIWISCVLGLGCGLIVPIANGLLAQYFTGKQRMVMMGVQSGVANFTLIIATVVVGWLGSINWHLPFIVYMVPVIPLVLMGFMSDKFIKKYSVEDTVKATDTETKASDAGLHFVGKNRMALLWGLILLYFFSTVGNLVITYYVPFRISDSTEVGIITSLFYLGVTVSGFILTQYVRSFKHLSMFLAFVIFGVGLYLLLISHTTFIYILSAVLAGVGYGIIQPFIYTKVTYLSPSPNKTTKYLAFILATNYVACSCAPFVFTAIEDVFRDHSQLIPFWSAAIFITIMAVLSIVFYKSYLFRVNIDNYAKKS